MKYIDAEKLIAEIERQIKELYIDEMDESVREALTNLLSFIASLQQEQPKVNLENEIEKLIRNIFYDLDGIAIIGTSKYASVEDMEYIARHFYELGLNARKEETK